MKRVEIIVVTYGQPRLERLCIESVKRHTNLEKYELTVVDNFQRDKNLGALWNELIEKSQCEWVCLLNSDTKIDDVQWLNKMLACGDRTAADAVGPMSNCVGFLEQRGQASNLPPQEVRTLSGFCLLLRKQAWQRARGFREAFTFYGQETNFLKRVGKKFISRDVFVFHHGSATATAVGRKSEEARLRDEFWQREIKFNWKQKLAILGLGAGIPGPLWRGIDEAVAEMRREGMTAKHFALETTSNEQLKAFAPDVVVTCSGTRCIERARDVLKGVKAQKGFWFNDLRRGGEVGAERFAGVFDGVFLCFRTSEEYPWSEWKKETGAEPYYMPQGGRVVTELEPLNIKRDLVFIGDTEKQRFHGDRRQIVEALGADVINGEPGSAERKTIEANSRATYRQSKFCLSISPAVNGYTSLRTYNIMSYGGLALTRHFPGIERLFENKHHMFIWHKLEQAKAMMESISVDEAEVIRKRAWRYQQAKHTALRRLMNIVTNLTTDDKEFWGYLS